MEEKIRLEKINWINIYSDLFTHGQSESVAKVAFKMMVASTLYNLCIHHPGILPLINSCHMHSKYIALIIHYDNGIIKEINTSINIII